MKEKQILEGARTLFEKYGYKRVSMDEIARKSGVTKKTVYSYFKSKEEFLKYFINEEIQNMKKIFENSEKPDRSFFDNLHEAICELIKYIKDRNFLNLIFEESESFKNPVIIENIELMEKAIQNYIKEKIQDAVDRNEIQVDNIDVMTFLIYKMYIALMFEWSDEYSKLNDKEIADNVIKIIRNGIERKDKNEK